MKTLNLSYINRIEIDHLYQTFGISDHDKISSKVKIEVSFLDFLKVSKDFGKDNKEYDTLDKLIAIGRYLESENKIIRQRPITTDELAETDYPFIFETTKARKFFFPKSKLAEVYGLNQLVVWVSEPDFNQLSLDPWTFTGSFLILIETIFERGEFYTTLSGCSALQALSNIITGSQFYTKDWNEPFGRNNLQHPYEKIEAMGGIPLFDHSIKTIYRARYMSDEQSFMHKEHSYRCNDLLAYPLFIDSQ